MCLVPKEGFNKLLCGGHTQTLKGSDMKGLPCRRPGTASFVPKSRSPASPSSWSWPSHSTPLPPRWCGGCLWRTTSAPSCLSWTCTCGCQWTGTGSWAPARPLPKGNSRFLNVKQVIKITTFLFHVLTMSQTITDKSFHGSMQSFQVWEVVSLFSVFSQKKSINLFNLWR